MSNEDELSLRNPPLAAFLAWLVPGLGHFYQGRRGKGLLYFVCVLGLFMFGFQQSGWANVYFRWNEDEWTYGYFGQLGAGAVAAPAILISDAMRAKLPGPFARFEAAPSDEELHDRELELGKRWDLAYICTVVAGLLNVLAVLDAYAGPALYSQERKYLARPPQ